MAVIGTGDWQDALEPIARLQSNVGDKEVDSSQDKLWDVKTSKKFTETLLEDSDISVVNQFSGSLEYETMAQGYKMTTTHTQFAKGVKVERIFWDTDQLDVAEKRSKALGKATRRRYANDSVYHLNNAFNSAYLTADALSLCNTAHTSNQSGISTTQSNTGVSPLSPESLEAARLAMRRFLSNKDQILDINPNLVICGDQNWKTAYEILESKGRPFTNNNEPNFFSNGKMSLLVDRRITGKKWFLADSSMIKDSCHWFDLTKPEYARDSDFDTLNFKWRVYFAYTTAVPEWRWVFGNNPS